MHLVKGTTAAQKVMSLT